MSDIIKSFGGTYASRLVAALFFFVSIASLVLLFLIYSDQMTEAVKTISLMLLGGLGTQSATAFNRLADPSQDDIVSLNRRIESLKKTVSEYEAKLTEQSATALATENMQREFIENLISKLEPKNQFNSHVDRAPRRIEDQSKKS